MLSLESLIGIVFNQITAYIIDVYEDEPDKGYFWATAFLTFLIFISFLFTCVLSCYDKEYGSKLVTGYREELEVEA